MKLCIISDTHTLHEALQIPECDVLIHCGDFSNMGHDIEFMRFLDWFQKQNAKYKVFICGNHELGIFRDHARFKDILKQWYPDLIYLSDSGVEIEGVYFYGCPWVPTFFDWGFMRDRGSYAMSRVWEAVPDKTQVLISHGPPWGVADYIKERDEHVGEPTQMEALRRVKPKINCFGHIHVHYGVHQIPELPETRFINAAICDEHYQPTRPPIVVEL